MNTVQNKQLSAIWHKFLELEARHSLCTRIINGVPFWDYLRFFVYGKILENTDSIGKPNFNNAPVNTLIKRLTMWLSALRHYIAARKVLKRPFEYIFINANNSRRKLTGNGEYMDLWCDPVIDHLGADKCLLLENYSAIQKIKSPIKTRHILFSDAFRVNRLFYPFEKRFVISTEEEAFLSAVKASFKEAFNIDIDWSSMLQIILFQQLVEWCFKKILERVKPKAVFVVCSFGNEGYIAACKQKGIPVIELQHGEISYYHQGYSYPDGGSKSIFPDYFFSFGSYWTANAKMPIPDAQCYAIGYPYLVEQMPLYHHVKKQKQILFLSTPRPGKNLSQFAAGLYALLPNDWRIVYKLHPSENRLWQECYPWLKEDRIKVICDDEPALYQLMAESSIQVSVTSTTVYEGLMFGCQTYLLDQPFIENIQELINKGYATVVTKPEQIDINANTDSEIDCRDIFAENWQSSLDAALTRCIRLRG